MTNKADLPPDTVERIGAYRVVRRLATGGTSDVLLAKAEGPHGFERTVVLKVLLSHFGKDDEVSRMFAREAAAYARLSHPAIVRLFDFFAVPSQEAKKGGQLVMVLEYVDGPPLARLKSMVKAIGKELDDKASIYVATCIFDALAAAHSATDEAQIPAPVIHRDVNPSNVLIPWDGYPKLADFGVAKVTGLGHQSVAGMVKGTYGYMSPEQVTGNEAVTPRSDVYAAAIILWELLTRRRAFQRGALPESEALRAMAEPRLPAVESIRSDVDRTIREALRRALEPRASSRKITAEEMVSILTHIVPLEEGRARLLSVLGLIRNDSRAASVTPSAPPPAMPPTPRSEPLLPNAVIAGAPKTAPDFAPLTMQGVAPPGGTGRPVSKGAPPRPASSARMPAAKPAPHPTRPALPAVVAPPQNTKSDPAMPAVRPKSAAAKLASSIPPEADDAPATQLGSSLDPFDATGPHPISPPPDSQRNAAPKDLTGGLGLRDAIDEIMKSSQRGIKTATPASGTASPGESDRPGMRDTTRVPPGLTQTLIGLIPPAPPPMTTGLPTDHSETQPPPEAMTERPPADMPDVDASADDEVPSTHDADDEPSPNTVLLDLSKTRPVHPALAQTLSMEARQVPSPPPLPSPSPSPPTKTGAMPAARFTPPPTPAVQTPSPELNYAPATVETTRPPPASRKGMGIGTLALTLVGVIALGIAGTVGFVRAQAQREKVRAAAHAASITMVAPRPSATPLPIDVGRAIPESPSATVARPELAAVAAPVESAAVAPAVVDAVAPKAVDAGAPAEALAEGMGRITTTGTAPGRRIFVDEKVLGQTPTAVTVKCGAHRVKLGSSGVVQEVTVPCGGDLAVVDVKAGAAPASARAN